MSSGSEKKRKQKNLCKKNERNKQEKYYQMSWESEMLKSVFAKKPDQGLSLLKKLRLSTAQ